MRPLEANAAIEALLRGLGIGFVLDRYFLFALNKREGIRLFCGVSNFFFGCLDAIIFYIFSKRCVEKDWFLTDYSELASEVVDVVVLEVHSVKSDGPFLGEIEPLEKLHNCAFPAP